MTEPDELLAIVGSSGQPSGARLEAARTLVESSPGPALVARLLDTLASLKQSLSEPERVVRVEIGQMIATLLYQRRDHFAAYREVSEYLSLLPAIASDDRKFSLGLFTELAVLTGRENDAIERVRALVFPEGPALATARHAVVELLKHAGRIDEAIEEVRRARQDPGLPPAEAGLLARETGILLERLGRFADAVAPYEEAVRLLTAAGSDDRVSALQSLSTGYEHVGRLDEAAQAADEAVSAAKGDYALAAALAGRGNVCLASGQARLAIQYFHSALVADARTGARKLEILLLNNIATGYMMLGQIRMVVMYRFWALDTAMELRDQPNKALALTALAMTYSPDAGRAMLTEAFEIYTELGDLHGQASALFGMAHACAFSADQDGRGYLLEDGVFFLEMARELAEAMGELALVRHIHAEMGQLAVKAGDAERAWENFERAWSLAESQRHLTTAESVRIQLDREGRGTVVNALDLALNEATESADAAATWRDRFFAMVERNRARALIDRLAAVAPADLRLPEEQRVALSELAARVRLRRGELAAARTVGAETEAQARQQLTDAHDRFNEYEAFLAQSHLPYRLLESTEPVSGATFDKHLGGTVAIIEYVAVRDTLISVTRARGRLTLHRHGDLAGIIEADRELTALCRDLADLDRAAQLSADLYRLLVAPITTAGDLDDISELIVVPASEVFGFPVDALDDGTGPLFEKYLVTYLPAASVAPLLAQVGGEYQPALVLADPDGTLPFARDEANVIADEFRLVGDGSPLVGAEATPARLRECAGEASLIHIAAHADFDPLAPTFSALRLAGAPFEVQDVLELRLPASLVVLSGCETGLGSAEGANEMIGFIRAFMVSGAAAVIASRWAVADAATGEYMRSLYSAMAYGEHPVVAMREARRDQIERNGYHHPGYWAPFTYFGLPPAWSPPRGSTDDR